jgi:hypothetical protein
MSWTAKMSQESVEEVDREAAQPEASERAHKEAALKVLSSFDDIEFHQRHFT